MHIPEVRLVYSWIYDQQWEIVWRYYKEHGYSARLFPDEYPGPTIAKEYIGKIRPLWQEVEQLILEDMSRITEIDWSVDRILGYVVGYHTPFSDPLTLPICRDEEVFIDNLTHELVHQLLSQLTVSGTLKEYWRGLKNKYPEVDSKTITHIPVHAIYEAVYREVFDEDRVQKDIRRSANWDSYRKSWEIVQSEGYQQVINELKQLRDITK